MKGQHQRKCFKKIHCFFLLLLDILQIVSNVCTYFYNGGGEKYPFIKGGMEGEGQKTSLRVLVLG